MPKYQKHIDRKNKLQQIKFTLSTKIKFSWSYFKKLIAMNTLFDKYIVNHVKSQLDAGIKEVRLYHSGDYLRHESLPKLYRSFCEEQNHRNICYSNIIFEQVEKQISLSFNKYLVENKGDLVIGRDYSRGNESYGVEYIFIKKN